MPEHHYALGFDSVGTPVRKEADGLEGTLFEYPAECRMSGPDPVGAAGPERPHTREQIAKLILTSGRDLKYNRASH